MPNKIKDILSKKFKDAINFSEDQNCYFILDATKLENIATFLCNSKDLQYNYLMCLSAYDLGESTKFGIAYNLYSTHFKHYIEIRIEFEENCEIQSVSHIWKTANWHEREAFDLMGIEFKNHPDMKRILLPEDWEGHPLRKDYKTPEYYKGMPVPKDKSYWE